jgi:hypothetical protein
MRYARQYLLADPSDCLPPHSLDLTAGSRDSIKVEYLEEAFRTSGFDPKEPALVGYPLEGKIQLLSGTHRHEAARRAEIQLPIRMVLRSLVEAAWATGEWEDIIEDVPVEYLELAPVKEGGRVPGLDERVDLSRDWA